MPKENLPQKGHLKVALAKAGDDTDRIDIEGMIGGDGFWTDGYNMSQLQSDLKASKAKNLEIRINSGGGYVSQGTAMFNTLRMSEKNITTVVTGYAASIASVIFLAGDTRIVNTGTRVMIHNPSFNWISGDAKGLRKAADDLDGCREDILDIYEQRTGMKRKELGDLMDAETWMSATESVDNGFATEKREDKAVAFAGGKEAFACFTNLPPELRADNQTKPNTTMNIKALLGLKDTATDAEVEKAVAALQQSAREGVVLSESVAKLTKERDEIAAKLKTHEDAAAKAATDKLKADAKAFAAKAVADKRIAEADAQKWADAFEKDAASAQSLLPSARDEHGHGKSLDCGSQTSNGSPAATAHADKVKAAFVAYNEAKDPTDRAKAYEEYRKLADAKVA